jgi:hypothetical protein
VWYFDFGIVLTVWYFDFGIVMTVWYFDFGIVLTVWYFDFGIVLTVVFSVVIFCFVYVQWFELRFVLLILVELFTIAA